MHEIDFAERVMATMLFSFVGGGASGVMVAAFDKSAPHFSWQIRLIHNAFRCSSLGFFILGGVAIPAYVVGINLRAMWKSKSSQ